MQNQYDYIVAGCGAAGLSLLLRMQQHPFFATKKILVIDSQAKTHNDRTWCFWQKEEDLFESIVYKKWTTLRVKTPDYERVEDISPYTYKMIRGIDFYNFAKEKLATANNITWITEKIVGITNQPQGVAVNTDTLQYTANFVFSSIGVSLQQLSANSNFLQQHFKGWIIETPTAVFDYNQATYMDFDVSQQHGTTFVYVLPLSSNKALVEYTLFTPNLITDAQYDEGLQSYINQNLKITDFKVLEVEKNIIPMSDFNFPKSDGGIVYIGTAGGATRGSSGYTFSFIQKQTKAIVTQLANNGHPAHYKAVMSSKAKFYDKVLLEVLLNSKLKGHQVFANMFRNRSITTFLPFLDDESSLLNDLKIITAQPTIPFVKAVFKIR